MSQCYMHANKTLSDRCCPQTSTGTAPPIQIPGKHTGVIDAQKHAGIWDYGSFIKL